MKILHISCSPRGRAAESYRLSRKIVDLLRTEHPMATLVDRTMGDDAVPHVDEEYAIALATRALPAVMSSRGSLLLSEDLIEELEQADAVVIGTPMHNFTVPSTLKAWIDHVVRVDRTFDITGQGKVGRLRDRPVFVAISSGGRYSGEQAHQPDFLTPYLKAILGTIGLHDLAFFSVEGTAAGPEAVADARVRADQALRDHFSR